jgi:hypothetical protein
MASSTARRSSRSATTPCSPDACPDELVCLLRTERCVEPARLNDAPIAVEDARLDFARRSRVPGFVDDAARFTLTTKPASLAVTPPRVRDETVELRDVPDVTNPRALEPVSAASAGTTVSLSFAVDEPVAALPTVDVDGPGPLTLLPVTQLDDGDVAVAFSFDLVVSDEATGVYAVTIGTVDDVGNADARELASIAVDTTPPDAVDTEAPGHARDVRVPWGRSGEPLRFVVELDGAFIEDGADVELYDGDLRIGLGKRGADGDYVVAVSLPADRPIVSVGLVWILDAAPGGFHEVDVAGGPSPRTSATMSRDPSGGAWMFGGEVPPGDNGILTNELWRLDGEAWSRVDVTGGPGPRSLHAMATDPVTGELVVVSGWAGAVTGNGLAYLDETWLFDPASTTWRRAPRRTNTPSPTGGSCRPPSTRTATSSRSAGSSSSWGATRCRRRCSTRASSTGSGGRTSSWSRPSRPRTRRAHGSRASATTSCTSIRPACRGASRGRAGTWSAPRARPTPSG